jgi:hypothetical protein
MIDLLREWTVTPAKTSNRYVDPKMRSKMVSKVNLYNGTYSVSWAAGLKFCKTTRCYFLPKGVPNIYAKFLTEKIGITFTMEHPRKGSTGIEFRKRKASPKKRKNSGSDNDIDLGFYPSNKPSSAGKFFYFILF